jgi:hypothetical protein
MRPVTRAPMSSTARRIRGPLGAVFASAVLVLAAVGPISAASPGQTSKASPWSKAPTRDVTKHRVASANIAGQLAVGTPRAAQQKAPPLRSVKIAHPQTHSAARLPEVSGATAVTPRIVSGPDLEVATQFAGLDTSEGGGFEPPDPWVAVNSTYIVQVVNSVARISNRVGTEISSVPTWALFALAAGQSDSDARIIWDATHARWVAISISFNYPDFTANYLNLAVSDGADPGAGWSTYSFFYGAFLPDYPSVASSTDKIVLTDDVYDSTFAFYAADLTTITWASILGGANLTGNECLDGSFIHPRAAHVLSSSADVHLIMELAGDGEQWYWRLTGAGSCGQIIDGTDLLGFAKFTPPPDPRQSPGETITTAFDERPTDAIWQNGQMWWVSTYPWTYTSGLNDIVVLWHVTTASVGSPTNLGTQIIAPGDGVDAFMGGIGMTRNGTLVTVYSQSSASDFVSLEANQIPPGGSLGTPIHLDDGDASYTGERWGDFAGVAMDPVGTGSVWATHQVAAADGTWRTDVVRLVADNDFPSYPGIVTSSLLIPTGLGASVPVHLAWTAATDPTSNVARYQIAQKIDLGSFVEVANVTDTSINRQLLIGHTYQFEVRAVDAVGNLGPWRVGSTLRPYLYQQTSGTVYTGTWSSQTNALFSGGSVRYASVAGRYATFTTTTARSIAFVTTKAPSRGSFRIYVDGVYRGTISTYSTTTKVRQVVYQFTWATPGTHKFKISVVGTTGHPRVDVDAFVVLR